MSDIPIDSEYDVAIREIVNQLDSETRISRSQLEEWMNSPCPEIQAMAFGCLVERESRCENIPTNLKVQFVTSFLKESICDNVENDFRLSRFDALLYCRSIVESECRSNRTILSRPIAEMLADISVRSNEPVRKEVVDVVLEHVLQFEFARRCFAFWRATPVLCDLYDEATELAEKWLKSKEQQ